MNTEAINKIAAKLHEDLKAYRKHQEDGGDLVKIVLTLHPWEDGLRWTVFTEIPAAMKDKKMIMNFIMMIEERLREAISPYET